MRYIFFALFFIFYSTSFAFDNVTFDNSTTDNSTDNATEDNIAIHDGGENYMEYPSDVAKHLDVSKDVNQQLKKSGLIFFPNAPGNALPIAKQNTDENEKQDERQDINILDNDYDR